MLPAAIRAAVVVVDPGFVDGRGLQPLGVGHPSPERMESSVDSIPGGMMGMTPVVACRPVGEPEVGAVEAGESHAGRIALR